MKRLRRIIFNALTALSLLVCVLLAMDVPRLLSTRNTAQQWPHLALPSFVLVVFATAAIITAPAAFRRASRDQILRAVAVAMRSAGLRGPFASSNRGAGLYVAYFLDTKLINIPQARSVAAYERDCRNGQVSCVLRSFRVSRGYPLKTPGKSGLSARRHFCDSAAELDSSSVQ